MERVFGIDVSTYQGKIDWVKAKNAGVKFAMIRVGYRGYGKSGNIKLDDQFENNVKGAISVDIPFGIYFYSQALNEKEAIEEANFVLVHILPYKNHITLPVVFDFEGFAKSNQRVYGMTVPQITACCEAFQGVVKANGFTCMLYGSQYYLPKKFDLDKLDDPLWVAKYTDKTTPNSEEKNKPKVNGYDDRIAIWQFASCGFVDGITPRVDMNYMYIDVTTDKCFDQGKADGKEDKPMKIYKKGVAVQLAKNFKSTEFDCNGKGCCDSTMIHTDLVKILQLVRDHFGVSVNLNCGYRCPEHNAKTKGASKNSKHMDGIAADIVVKGVHPMRVARYIETLPEFRGRLGVYTWNDKGDGFVHVDVRGTNSRAIYTENNTYYDTVPSFHVAVKQGMKGRVVKVVQRKLRSEKLYLGLIDGKCGKGTTAGIMKFNAKHGRLQDASWGKKCWNEAFPI